MQSERSTGQGSFNVALALPSSQVNVAALDPLSVEIGKKMEDHGFQKSDNFWVTWAVVELGTNAMKHGNQWDPNKKAEISCVIGKDVSDYPGREVVRLTVEDEGGKNLQELPDPKAYVTQYQEKVAQALALDSKENTLLNLPSGRGWLVLIERSDKVAFEHTSKGLKITAIFVKGSEVRKKPA